MNPVDLIDIITAVETAVRAACMINHDPNKKGGYLCISDYSGVIMAVVLIGKIDSSEKRAKYLSVAQEKAVRLASNPDHISSWQSRNPQEGKYGGAIRIKDYILSFSGLPEEWDDACMIVVASGLPGKLKPKWQPNAATISSNNHDKVGQLIRYDL